MSDFNRIIINEIDETTPNRADSIVDVVSVIGFPGIRGTSLSDNIKPSVKDINDKDVSVFTLNIDNAQCNRAFDFNSLDEVKAASEESKPVSKTIEFRTVDAASKPLEAGWYIPTIAPVEIIGTLTRFTVVEGAAYDISSNVALLNIVRDDRSNYTINGEEATVITVPTAIDGEGNEYQSYQGLESASWRYAWTTASTYAVQTITYIGPDIESLGENQSFTMTYIPTSDYTLNYSNPISLSSYGIALNTNGYALENGTKIVLDFYAKPFVYCKSSVLVPQYLETISDFEDMFGTAPMQLEITDENDKVIEVVYDKSYIYAKELLNAGLPVVYTAVAVEDEDTGEYVYPEEISEYSPDMMEDNVQIGKICEILKDKNSYTIKYVTLGGYASFDMNSSPVNNSIAELLLGVCLDRGDCVALIDTNDTEDLDSSVVINAFRTSPVGTNHDGAYATCIYPWGDYRCLTIADDKDTTYKDERIQAMPGSFGYLLALAKSIKTNANWLAIAGATRGQVPQLIRLRSKNKITAAIADSFQEENKININAITEINPYGLCIWGNRTLKNNTILNGTTATSFLNLRNLVSDVKKVVYRAAKRLLFEQNSDILWVNFQSEIMTTLEQMKSGAGISGYKILRLPSDKKTKVKAQVVIYPIYAVEQIEVTITLRDEEVDVQAQ